ncbi:uncharacterized protein FIBRA_05412 [Fibroporia radiculosa]|uniref:DUF6533 domain-containing protein n=1 Tax=Fibroporia radiculosa TaxID=599839 RepID=J4H3H5_9APHY|nr:uncharacterized protein FIBRA_05412 [Fibroporia radiculosa]CCM03284.1 predicted protein [Fibroporia radiculosa]
MNSTTESEVLGLAVTLQFEAWFAIAALCWLVYDWLLSFGDEVQLIWRSEATLPKILYSISRYLGLVMQALIGSKAIPFYCVQNMIFYTV